MTISGAAKTVDPREMAALDVLAVASFAALFAGLALVTIAAFRRFVLHQLTFNSLDIAWMAPLGTLAVFLIPAVPIAIAAALAPRLIRPRLVFGLFGFLALLSILLLFRLRTAASLLLALGAAWQLAVSAARRSGAVLRRLRLGASAMAGVTALLAALVLLVLPAVARRHSPSTAPPGAPNVLLLLLDTVRAEELGMYGYPKPTSPRIDDIAARGVVFDRAIAPSSWTLASHASMFTGRRPGELSARWWTPLDRAYPTVAEVLRDHGYRTAGFAANFAYTGVESGLSRGFQHYEDLVRTWRQVVWSSALAQVPLVRSLASARTGDSVWAALRRHELRIAGRARSRDHKTAARATGDLLRWLERQERGPFFAFINFFDAHELSEPLEPAFDTFGRGERARYDGFLARIDQAIGDLIDTLGQRGVLDNTIVIITSDHGELFGEHGIKGHGNGLHMPALWVPLIVVHPRHVPAGIRVAHPVALQDLAATFVDLAGLPPGALPGTPLSRYWRAGHDSSPARAVYSEVERFKDPESPGPAASGPMRSLIDADWHYILHSDGRNELFDWRRDSDELHNLAASGRQPPPNLTRLSGMARAITSRYR